VQHLASKNLLARLETMDYSLTLYHPLNPLLKELEVRVQLDPVVSGLWVSIRMRSHATLDDFLTSTGTGRSALRERDVTFSRWKIYSVSEVALDCLEQGRPL
jgi:hypothetical protein